MESRESILKTIEKARLLGLSKQYQTACSHSCELLSTADETILLIPNNVREINEYGTEKLNVPLDKVHNCITIIGGGKLKSLYSLLSGCDAISIDLRFLDISTVKNMENTFFHCKAHAIYFGDWNTDTVCSMKGMFRGCYTKELLLNNFTSKSLLNTSYMFYKCKCNKIELKSKEFKITNQTISTSMFDNIGGYDRDTIELIASDNIIRDKFVNRKNESAVELVTQ